jgi:hypothetical protein
LGFTFVLEAHGDVIDAAHDDDLTLGNTAYEKAAREEIEFK